MSKAEFINRLFRQRERRLRFGPGIFDPILGDTPNVGTASGSAGPFGGFEFGTPAFFPLLVNEPWNYATGALNANAPWSASTGGVSVTQGQFISVGDSIAGVNNTAQLTTSPGYLPNKAYAFVGSLASAHAGTAQVSFDIGLASQWFVRWVAGGGAAPVLTFGSGGAGSDANITDSTSFGGIPLNTVLSTVFVNISVGPLVNGNRIAKVVATFAGSVVGRYTRNIKAPSANTAQNFNFTTVSNLQDTGVDAQRFGPFQFRGFTT